MGDVYAKLGYVTGPAHLAAVQAEEQSAFSPRVTVDEPVVRLVAATAGTEEAELFRGLLLQDGDGEFFLDYLPFLISEAAPPDVEQWEILDDHRRVVGGALELCDAAGGYPRVRQKLEWVAGYHDGVCERLGVAELQGTWEYTCLLVYILAAYCARGCLIPVGCIR